MSGIPRPPTSSSSLNGNDDKHQQAKLYQMPRILVDFVAPPPTTITENSNNRNQDDDDDNVDVDVNDNDDDDNDWDLLSDRLSTSNSISNNNNSKPLDFLPESMPVFVPKAGSVRSINTCDFDNESSSHNNGTRSSNNNNGGSYRSFKIQRTHSNSTIDSNDDYNNNNYHTLNNNNNNNNSNNNNNNNNSANNNNHNNNSEYWIGPSGKGILGVDYVEHVILPTDTLQGICLAYKISTTRLRQANHFSGHSLLLAPKKLVIPISKSALRAGFIRVQDTDAKEYKLYSFLAEFSPPKKPQHSILMGVTEAKAYLELSDWDLKAAIRSAKEDIEWEQEMDTSLTSGGGGDGSVSGAGNGIGGAAPQQALLKSGQIRITSSSSAASGYCLQAQGAGIRSPPRPTPAAAAALAQSCSPNEATAPTPTAPQDPPKPPRQSPAPTTTTKSQSILSSSFTSPFSMLLRRTTSRIVSPTASNDEDCDGLEDSHKGGGRSSSTAAAANHHPNKGVTYTTVPPAIASKSVGPQDLYQAATTQHDHYGVELKTVSSASTTATTSAANQTTPSSSSS